MPVPGVIVGVNHNLNHGLNHAYANLADGFLLSIVVHLFFIHSFVRSCIFSDEALDELDSMLTKLYDDFQELFETTDDKTIIATARQLTEGYRKQFRRSLQTMAQCTGDPKVSFGSYFLSLSLSLCAFIVFIMFTRVSFCAEETVGAGAKEPRNVGAL